MLGKKISFVSERISFFFAFFTFHFPIETNTIIDSLFEGVLVDLPGLSHFLSELFFLLSNQNRRQTQKGGKRRCVRMSFATEDAKCAMYVVMDTHMVG